MKSRSARNRIVSILAVLLSALATGRAAPTYRHARMGNIDIVTSASDADTAKLLYEMRSIRALLQEVIGAVAAPDPSMHVLIFPNAREVNRLFPTEESGFIVSNVVSAHTVTDSGGTLMMVEDPAHEDYVRQTLLVGYALSLVHIMAPRVPSWLGGQLVIWAGCGEYHDGMMEFGHLPAYQYVRRGTYRLYPLKDVLGGRTFKDGTEAMTADEERWELWSYWLTENPERNRPALHRLFAAIRRDEPMDAAAVSRAFGVPLKQMRDDLESYSKSFQTPLLKCPPADRERIAHLTFTPATDLELKRAFVQMSYAIPGQSQSLYASLSREAEAHPDDPANFEALAQLAELQKQQDLALQNWTKARSAGSTDSYAYLLALNGALDGFTDSLSLDAQISARQAEQYRDWVDRCLAGNPGLYFGYYWLGWIECLAPDPQRERLDRIASHDMLPFFPGLYLPMAIARFRAGQEQEAERLINEYLDTRNGHPSNAGVARQLLGMMQAAAKAKS